MIKEFDRIILSKDLAGTNFIKGDIGTVVMIYENGKGFEIEFLPPMGQP